MKFGRVADFFFVGVAVVPVVLVLAGFPELAVLNMIPLFFAACLFGIAEQLEDGETKKKP
jgi:hypothetical protein